MVTSSPVCPRPSRAFIHHDRDCVHTEDNTTAQHLSPHAQQWERTVRSRRSRHWLIRNSSMRASLAAASSECSARNGSAAARDRLGESGQAARRPAAAFGGLQDSSSKQSSSSSWCSVAINAQKTSSVAAAHWSQTSASAREHLIAASDARISPSCSATSSGCSRLSRSCRACCFISRARATTTVPDSAYDSAEIVVVELSREEPLCERWSLSLGTSSSRSEDGK